MRDAMLAEIPDWGAVGVPSMVGSGPGWAADQLGIGLEPLRLEMPVCGVRERLEAWQVALAARGVDDPELARALPTWPAGSA